jgi:hypothetical protein
MGQIVASTYDVVFVSLTEKQCWTYLPLRNPPKQEEQHKIISIPLIGTHFIKVQVHDNSAVPPVPCW